ncbi:MAG: TetR/AcrR family transcriptional regulator [Opitutales bacterium]|nr:TetR/AcrR family transcriptional regulator [Opitutales bacterium]
MTKNHSQRKGANIQGARKRKKLLAAAGEAFAKLGFEAATMRDIAKIARVQPSALIYHFDNKKNLFYETLRHHLQDNPSIAALFAPLDAVKKPTPAALSEAIYATTKNVIAAIFGPEGKVPHLRGLVITMLIDGDKSGNYIIKEFGVHSMTKADEILSKIKPGLDRDDLFWARHFYWSMILYLVLCEKLLLAHTDDKQYSAEFLESYAYRMTAAYCDRFGLPSPKTPSGAGAARD